MAFKDNLNRICEENGTTVTAVVKSLGLSTSKVTRWKHTSLPKEEQLYLLADKLNCTVADFFLEEFEKKKYSELSMPNDDEQEILEIYKSLTRREKHRFMMMAYGFESKAST